MKNLILDDILDLREYERIRENYITEIIAKKKNRRVHIGPIISLLFENRDTVKFQIQEMARAEKIITDEGIQAELDTYNTLIPESGQLKATLFIELTNQAELRTWLPRLVGIQNSIFISDAAGSIKAHSKALADHEQFLTKEEITPSVHYIKFDMTDFDVDELIYKGLVIGVDHPQYQYQDRIDNLKVEEILSDLKV